MWVRDKAALSIERWPTSRLGNNTDPHVESRKGGPLAPPGVSTAVSQLFFHIHLLLLLLPERLLLQLLLLHFSR